MYPVWIGRIGGEPFSREWFGLDVKGSNRREDGSTEFSTPDYIRPSCEIPRLITHPTISTIEQRLCLC
jgi:hypothetical protein